MLMLWSKHAQLAKATKTTKKSKQKQRCKSPCPNICISFSALHCTFPLALFAILRLNLIRKKKKKKQWAPKSNYKSLLRSKLKAASQEGQTTRSFSMASQTGPRWSTARSGSRPTTSARETVLSSALQAELFRHGQVLPRHNGRQRPLLYPSKFCFLI